MEAVAGMTDEGLIRFLSENELDYEIVEHSPVFTIEEAMETVPHLDGIKTKNVFARDAKGNRHFLVIVPHDRRINLTELAQALSSTKLSMGSADRLQRHLGVTSGAVSVFSLINDSEKKVELVIDEKLWRAARIQGHPLRNTATVSIAHAALKKFLEMLDHAPRVMHVP